MKTSDSSLVQLAQSGDGMAFGQLVSRHYDLIFRLSFRLLGRKSDAEDLTQDICATLPSKLQSFRGEAKFTTWLYRVVSNAATDRLRKRSSRTKAAGGWGEVEQLTRAGNAQQREELIWLQNAMSALPGDLQATVALVLGEELTHAAAGEALGVSEGTISWRMSEVKKALRAQAIAEERTR